MTESDQLEQKLRAHCGYVRVTYDATKKRPWRVEIWKCKRCRETFIGDAKADALEDAWVRAQYEEKT